MSKCVRMLCVISVGVMICGLGACGTGTDNSGADDETEAKKIPLNNLADRIAEVYCTEFRECCSTSEQNVVHNAFPDINLKSKANCRDSYAAFLGERMPEIRAARDNGRIEYHAREMGECVSTITSSNCAEFSPDGIVQACQHALPPAVGLGGTCKHEWECEEGRCIGENGVSDDSLWTCKRGAAGGETCSDTSCRENYFCKYPESTCKPKRGIGEQCESATQCESGFCTESGACAPKKAGGESCPFHSVCKSDYCNKGGTEEGMGSCLGTPMCDGS